MSYIKSFVFIFAYFIKFCSNYRVVVMSEGHPPEVLTKLNSVIRRIDLICKLFAPVATGFLISFVSLKASAVTLAIWNLSSVCLEYWLLLSVYNKVPALTEYDLKRSSVHSIINLEEGPSTSEKRSDFFFNDSNNSELLKGNCLGSVVERICNNSYVKAWQVYMSQDVLLPGLALALLYFTVLR